MSDVLKVCNFDDMGCMDYTFRIPLDEPWIDGEGNERHDFFIFSIGLRFHPWVRDEWLDSKEGHAKFEIANLNFSGEHFSPRYEWVDFVTGERYHKRGSWDW